MDMAITLHDNLFYFKKNATLLFFITLSFYLIKIFSCAMVNFVLIVKKY